MNSGYVLFCGNATFPQCFSRRLYTCSDKHADEAKTIPEGAVLFMYNPDSKTLVGPFTAAGEGASRIETGTWASTIDEHSASANVKLEWEDLHIIEKASNLFAFLEKPKKCRLSPLWTQTLLNALKDAPLYKG
jgi:hypothetical protein